MSPIELYIVHRPSTRRYTLYILPAPTWHRRAQLCHYRPHPTTAEYLHIQRRRNVDILFPQMPAAEWCARTRPTFPYCPSFFTTSHLSVIRSTATNLAQAWNSAHPAFRISVWRQRVQNQNHTTKQGNYALYRRGLRIPGSYKLCLSVGYHTALC